MKAIDLFAVEMKLERLTGYVKAIREDSVVGVDSLSVIDECWSDSSLRSMLDETNVMSNEEAIENARRIHEVYLDTDS